MNSSTDSSNSMSVRLAIVLAALIAALAVLLLPLPVPRNAITVKLEDAGHIPLVFVLCLLCLWVLSATRLSLTARCLLTLAAGVAFGAGTEILQAFTGRDASWLDFRADSLGAASAVALHWLWSTRRRFPRVEAPRRSLGVALLAVAALALTAVMWLVPLSSTLLAWHERAVRFPVLYAADFRHGSFVIQPVGTTRRPLQAQSVAGRLVLPVRCGTARFSGVTLDGLPRDWRAWHSLQVLVANPTDAPFDLGIHVRGLGRRMAYDERFNTHLTLRAHETRNVVLPITEIIKGPRGEPLDPARIWSIGIFCAGEAREFELLRVALQ